MTADEINIAIGEADGWTFHIEGNDSYWSKTMGEQQDYDMPDYCHDLNAMHEVEKCLGNVDEVWPLGQEVHRALNRITGPRNEWDRYCAQLAMVADNYHVNGRKVIHATARQRAEAFLRTIGKWKE